LLSKLTPAPLLVEYFIRRLARRGAKLIYYSAREFLNHVDSLSRAFASARVLSFGQSKGGADIKIFAIFLALLNMLISALIVASCLSTSQLKWESLGWLAARVAAGTLVIAVGLLTWRDAIQPLAPNRLFLGGLSLIILGVACIVWAIHLTLISGDVKNAMLSYGGSVLIQGFASVWGLMQNSTA
jgi:hypothetical protein